MKGLRANRVILRLHDVSDLDDAARLWSDEHVVRFIGGTPHSRAQTWARLLRYSGLWGLLGYGYWAIEDRATGRFIGDVGFADFGRENDPMLPAVPEIGWAIFPEFAGQGIATEAATLALSWVDNELAADATFCIIDPGNTASHRVAKKIGYLPATDVTIDGKRQCVLTRIHPDRVAACRSTANFPALSWTAMRAAPDR